jgi:hypothetical protein
MKADARQEYYKTQCARLTGFRRSMTPVVDLNKHPKRGGNLRIVATRADIFFKVIKR